MNTVNMNNVNSALKSAAASTKSVAGSTAQAISHLVDEAHDRLSDVSVPSLHMPAIHLRHKKSHRGRVFALVALGAGLVFAVVRFGKRREVTPTSDAATFVANESPFTLKDAALDAAGDSTDSKATKKDSDKTAAA